MSEVQPAATAEASNSLLGGTPPPAATPPAATPPASEYAAGDWRSSLPPELQQEAMFKTIADVNTLAKSYVHAQKTIGADKVALPNKHATEEDWHRFYQKVGLPESPDKYEVTIPKEAKFVNDDLMKELKPIAHKAGILPKQLETLVSWYEQNSSKSLEASIQQSKQEIETQVMSLKKEWGQAFNNNLGLANKVLKDHGPEGIGEYLKKTGLDNDPNLVKLLAQVGKAIYKEDQVLGEHGTSSGIYDPATALKKANDILGDSNHPYHNTMHPNHAAAVAEVQGLFSQAYSQT